MMCLSPPLPLLTSLTHKCLDLGLPLSLKTQTAFSPHMMDTRTCHPWQCQSWKYQLSSGILKVSIIKWDGNQSTWTLPTTSWPGVCLSSLVEVNIEEQHPWLGSNELSRNGKMQTNYPDCNLMSRLFMVKPPDACWPPLPLLFLFLSSNQIPI